MDKTIINLSSHESHSPKGKIQKESKQVYCRMIKSSV